MCAYERKKFSLPMEVRPPPFFVARLSVPEFAENFPVTGNQFGAFTAKGVILRVAPDDAEGVKNVGLSEFRRPLHHRMGVQHATFAQFHIFANHRVGANLDAFAKFRARRHGGLRVNLVHLHFADFSAFATASRSTILHISVASAANCPFTVALPSSFQKSPRHESTFISTFNWSPGTTGRRFLQAGRQ